MAAPVSPDSRTISENVHFSIPSFIQPKTLVFTYQTRTTPSNLPVETDDGHGAQRARFDSTRRLRPHGRSGRSPPEPLHALCKEKVIMRWTPCSAPWAQAAPHSWQNKSASWLWAFLSLCRVTCGPALVQFPLLSPSTILAFYIPLHHNLPFFSLPECISVVVSTSLSWTGFYYRAINCIRLILTFSLFSVSRK